MHILAEITVVHNSLPKQAAQKAAQLAQWLAGELAEELAGVPFFCISSASIAVQSVDE